MQENFDFDTELGRCLTANYDHDNWAGGMSLDNLFNDHVHVAVFHTDGCKAWWRSHLSVVRTDSVRWNDRYGYADHCLDEAATKGFRRYELTTREGYQLVVYNMHMEATAWNCSAVPTTTQTTATTTSNRRAMPRTTKSPWATTSHSSPPSA